jgi:hypothetical protein
MTHQINYHRKRIINFVIGLLLAALHAVASVNFLNDNWRFENFSGTSLMEACVRAGWLAAGLALTVTIAALVLVKRIKQIPSLLMVLLGNYLCPFGFLMIFQPLFHQAVDRYWVAPAGINDPKIILHEVLKLNAYDCFLGLFAGLVVSGVATLAAYSSSGPQPEKK